MTTFHVHHNDRGCGIGQYLFFRWSLLARRIATREAADRLCQQTADEILLLPDTHVFRTHDGRILGLAVLKADLLEHAA